MPDLEERTSCKRTSQAVVDSAVIVGAGHQTRLRISNAAAMMEETIDNVGAPRGSIRRCWLLLGKGSRRLYALGVDPFVAPEQTRHGRVVPPAPRGRIPSLLSPRDRMRRKLQTRRGRQRYALRMQTVEPVFGQIQGRGFRQFLLRGREGEEWSLICTGATCSNCSAQICTGKHGSIQRIRNFAR